MKKNIILFFVAIGTLVLSSCTDFLDTQSSSEQTSEVIFNNEGMTRSAIMGIYSQLSSTMVYGQKMSVNWQGVSDIELASGYPGATDTDKTSDTGAANYWCDWYNNTVNWNDIFKLAELASTAVEGIRNSPMLTNNPTVMEPYLGEALALRSLAYFELTRRWGDIPFKTGTSNSDLSNVYMGKIDRDSVYSSIVTDMSEAIEYLPWVGENADYNCERITKGFAKGLLARIALFAGGWSVRDGNQFSDANVEHYPSPSEGMAEMNGYYVGRPKNWQEYYQIAEQQCAEILGDPANPHQLDPDFGNIWKTVCGLGYNSYNENLFEIANGLGYSGDIGTLMGRATDAMERIGSRGFGGSYVCTNGYYFYSFTPSDKRRNYSAWFPKLANTDKEVMQSNIMNVNLGKWDFEWTSDAYKALHLTATARVATGINWILMRTSDIYLMFAEARYALYGADTTSPVAQMSAREALETVRKRAFGDDSPEITKYDSDFMEAIINERAWEFGGEGIRKLDLGRWGILDKKIEAMKEAMCLMFDAQHPVTIFDKTYQPTDFPDKIYWKFNPDGRTIDIDNINFYRRVAVNPDPSVYTEVRWFPIALQDPNKAEDYAKNNYAKILIAATGLRASYNYSELLSKLQFGNEIELAFKNFNTGNKVCNYRNLYPINYETIYKSNGYLENSYGFDYNN